MVVDAAGAVGVGVFAAILVVVVIVFVLVVAVLVGVLVLVVALLGVRVLVARVVGRILTNCSAGCIASTSFTNRATKSFSRAQHGCFVRAYWVEVQQRSTIMITGLTHQSRYHKSDREGSTP